MVISSGTADRCSTNFSYKAGTQGRTTTKVECINNKGNIIQYTYDKLGNIETITENGKAMKYYYNELIRKDNKVLDKTRTLFIRAIVILDCINNRFVSV